MVSVVGRLGLRAGLRRTNGPLMMLPLALAFETGLIVETPRRTEWVIAPELVSAT